MENSSERQIALVLSESDDHNFEAVYVLGEGQDLGGVRGGWPSKRVAVITAQVYEPRGARSEEGQS